MRRRIYSCISTRTLLKIFKLDPGRHSFARLAVRVGPYIYCAFRPSTVDQTYRINVNNHQLQ